MELKQSTVAIVKIGPFTATTGTVLTDLTIAQANVRLSKDGGNMGQKSTGTACVHDELGVYFCDLSATDTGTLGALRLDVDKSGSAALMIWHFYEIVTSQYYDAKYGTGRFPADVQELDGASAAAAEFLNMYDGTGYAGGAIRFGADVQEIDGASAGISNLQNFFDGTGYAGGTIKLITTGGTVSTIAAGAISSSSFMANAITAGVIADAAIDIATFAADVKTGNNLNAHVAKFTANSLTAGVIADAAIDAATFATGALAAGAASGATIAANALGASATTIAANALGASATTIAAAVWNATAASYDTNNAFGNIINDLTEDSGGIYRFTSAALALGVASANSIIGSGTAATNLTAFFDGDGYAGGAIRFGVDIQEIDSTSACVVNMQNMYDGTGYAGGTIKFITTGGTVSTIAAGAIASNSFVTNAITAGVIAPSAIDIATFASDVKTGNYLNVQVKAQDNIDFGALQKTSLNAATPASIAGAVGSVTGSIGSLAAQAKTDVNAEVVDALATDTYAEPGQGAPGATTTIVTKIGYIYKAFRNKVTQTSAAVSLYADDASTIDQTATITDDGTTFTRGEIGSGA